MLGKPARTTLDAERTFLDRLHRRAARAEERRGEPRPKKERKDPLRIGRADAARYEPPPFLARVIAADELDRFRRLLAELEEANGELVGESLEEQEILLNGDPAVLAWRAELRSWLERYVSRRLQRPHPRDQGDPFRTFVRLFDELGPWLENLSLGDPVWTVHRLFLDEAPSFFGWTLFDRTWGRQIRFEHRPEETRVDWGSLPEAYRKVAHDLLATMEWHPESTSERLVTALGSGPEPSDALSRAQELAEDIAEMRPLLVRGFKPEKTIVQVAPELFVAWSWNVGHRVGTILAAPSERSLREHLSMSMSDAVVHVQFDGSVSDRQLPWRRLSDLPGGRSATLRLLEPLHRVLFSFYDRIDLGALVREARPTRGAGDEAIAASCEELRCRSEPTPRLGLRTTELFSVLRRLGCEIRSGKGSEIAIYRPGARIWTLAHHKRNPRVGWASVRRMLQRLEIPTEDWLAAIR